MLILVIGDLHVPHRATDLPPAFSKLLVPGKIQQTLCTGNLCDRETYDQLRSISADMHIVRGDMDEVLAPGLPVSKVISHGVIRIGLIHGHQIIPTDDNSALEVTARQMDVDVLISGHTHRHGAAERGGRFYVNPGSATGAYSSVSRDPGSLLTPPFHSPDADPVPSFMLMDIQGGNVVTYVYTLDDGEVKVEKIDYHKPM
ncbi:vacuolar sorting protein vps29 [Piptocephalis cylindrospora]|uniref:Vacuolar protein sorting-associated protein 29 n=1 Tax=Piptocephalis cylindrospora TaxID=1907219 RepID=A0A4P9Y3A2_9FUNG|nr:vacuolar sorting protein vps29 [Piptocephalis cylindrospora]|eukprot:RKP13102.1 vacuolar sorting protein vps29 [Piptocephalis cylindrospora]